MSRKIQWKYFFVLLVPLLVVLLLGMWLNVYSHSRSMRTMQKDVEQSNQRTIESVAVSIDTLLDYCALNASNLSFQVDALQNSSADRMAMYNNAITKLIFMQLNSESLLNAAMDRGYVFLFHENRVITKSNTWMQADTFYEQFFEMEGMDYAAFQQQYSQRFYAGEIIPDATISYQGTPYKKWLLVQSIPIDPSQTPQGIIVFTLDEDVIIKRLADGLASDASVCMLYSTDGAMITAQGTQRIWDVGLVSSLTQQLEGAQDGVHYLTLTDGTEYLVTVIPCSVGAVVSAQPVSTVFSSVNQYNTTILLMMMGVVLLASAIAMTFTHRHMHAMRNVLGSIAPQHQSENAKDVFIYMEEAFQSAQKKEDVLLAHAEQQRFRLRTLFLKRLLRGELQTESDVLQEQFQTGVNLEASAYVVVMLHFWEEMEMDKMVPVLRAIFCNEFGEDRTYLVKMTPENIACLLTTDEPDLRESIEAVAEELIPKLHVSMMVSGTVSTLMEIPHAYRQVRTMSRMVQEDEPALQWYNELFQDDVLYNFEYSIFTENSLRNNIIAGNMSGTEEMLNDLYEKSIKSSVRSDHVLRFFAYDLYRLVNHLGVSSGMHDRQEALQRMRKLLDVVMEDSKQFDSYFTEIKQYCLLMCQQYHRRRAGAGDKTLNRMMAYVNEKFTDPNLSVGSMADDLNLSIKYLSLFFKEQTGEKLSSYIERKRIDYATQLLDTTDMTINAIAQASGYTLTHTFRVAFKKVQGVSPLEWKKNRQMDADDGSVQQ